VEAFAAFGRWLSNTAYWVMDLVDLVAMPARDMCNADEDEDIAPNLVANAFNSDGVYASSEEAAADGAFINASGGESGGPGIYI
jgi:hypothetical protein